MTTKHVHEVTSFTATSPSGTTGYQHCRCGATRRVEKGIADRGWHTCKLCTHPWGMDAEEEQVSKPTSGDPPALVLEYQGRRIEVLGEVDLDDVETEHGRHMVLSSLESALRDALGVSDE